VLSATVKDILAGLALSLLASQALAHGAFVDVAPASAVSISARYDTGEVMADAQVAVFAPDDPAQPWLTDRTDAAGRFVFVPDDRAGRWAIQVRHAGHGAMGYAEIGADSMITAVTAARGAGLSVVQKLLMLACMIWGAVGTALYFRRTTTGAKIAGSS